MIKTIIRRESTKMARNTESGVNCVSFDQDKELFVVGLTSGFRTYFVDPVIEAFHYSAEESGEVILCELLFNTNIIFIVLAQTPNDLCVFNQTRRCIHHDIFFNAPIRAIRARMDRLAVMVETCVHVLEMLTWEPLTKVYIPVGCISMCDIASTPESRALMVTPAFKTGAVQLTDVGHNVHQSQSSSPVLLGKPSGASQLTCVALSQNGARVALATNSGTLISIWDTATRTCQQQVKRGTDSATIYSMCFNRVGTQLACVSDKGTLHVWALGGVASITGTGVGGWGRVATVHEAAAPQTRAVCAFYGHNRIMILSVDGKYNKFTLFGKGQHYHSGFDYFLEMGEDDDF